MRCSDTEELAQQANAAFERAYERLIDEGRAEPIDGAAEAITRLRERESGWRSPPGSAAPRRRSCWPRWAGSPLRTWCSRPATGCADGRIPDLILTALMRLGVDGVRNVAALGDTSSDIESALRAGAAIAAGTLTGAHDESSSAPPAPPTSSASVTEFADLILHDPLTKRRNHEATQHPSRRCDRRDRSATP